MLVALGYVDRGLPLALGLGDQRALRAVRRERSWVIACWMSALRRDLADLDGAHLDAPADGLLRDLDLQPRVDLLAAGQHILDGEVADDGAQRGGRQVADGDDEVVDVDDRVFGLRNLEEDDEVHVDERVVLRDRGLLGLLDHELSQVDAHAVVDERDQDHEPRARACRCDGRGGRRPPARTA